MNIKSLLIGSAAALVAFSGAQAADAIVAAEPEAVEYVKVCDAFGTGYFYIPGTETCLKIGGFVRVQLAFGRGTSAVSDYDVWARAHLDFTAKNDTEFGALTSHIALEGTASKAGSNGVYDASDFGLDEAYIDLAGVRAGLFYSWWDDGLAGETDTLATNSLFASVRYTYTGEAFSAGLSVDELTSAPGGVYEDANIGIAAMVSGAFGPVKATVIGGYDIDSEEFATRGIVSADVGPGAFELAAVYASGKNAYFNESEISLAAAYAFKATDKLKITPAAQYFWDKGFVNGVDGYKVGLTVDYAITSGLAAKATVNYEDGDNMDGTTTGFLRLQRDF